MLDELAHELAHVVSDTSTDGVRKSLEDNLRPLLQSPHAVGGDVPVYRVDDFDHWLLPEPEAAIVILEQAAQRVQRSANLLKYSYAIWESANKRGKS